MTTQAGDPAATGFKRGQVMKKTVFFMVIGLILSGCALQRDVYMLEERIATLEQNNRRLQEHSKRLEAQRREIESKLMSVSRRDIMQLRENYARIAADLDRIDQETRLVQGRLEEVEFVLRKKLGKAETDFQARSKRLEDIQLQLARLEKRVARLEQYLSIESGKPGKPAGKPAAVSAPPTPESLYRAAKKDLDEGRMASARKGFQALIKAFPKSEKADNAQFWIAESYYREKWYEKAILEYQEVIDKYPKGNKVPAAMLKQAMAFLKLKDKANARLVLSRLVEKFPGSNEAKIAKQKLKSL